LFKKKLTLIAAALFLAANVNFNHVHATTMENIRLNQLGYYPDSRKVAVIIDESGKAAPTGFIVVSVPDNRIVFRGNLSQRMEWEDSGEKGWRADFSAVTAPGRYRLVLLGNVRHMSESYTFEISDRVFRDVANASMRTFYFQRCSTPLDRRFAGRWARPAGHPDTAVTFHPSSGRWRGEGPVRSRGGWYDAGDFGKYIINSGISVGTLLAFYELFPDYFPDRSLNIPESGNGRPDILDEVKYNLDWMKTMQDIDGGVWVKLTTLEFPGYMMPHEDRWERFIIGKSTTSALNFAASMAMAGRVYMPFDSAYAQDAIRRARLAWDWAVRNPNVPFTNPEDVKTGEYRDVNFDDEFIWAAAELFITTGEKRFEDFLADKEIGYQYAPSWQNVHSLASLSLSTINNNLPAERLNAVRRSVVTAADRWLAEIDSNLYRVPNGNFIWGSNSIFANKGICLVYAYILTRDRKYLLGAAEIADYLLGKNAVGMSFMTAFGTNYAKNPHHRQIVAQKVGVIPGFLVGGPNKGQQDSIHEVVYTSNLPAKSFEDVYKSYASNEVAINWNSPSTFLFAAIDALMQRRN
jgi:endoglucanase